MKECETKMKEQERKMKVMLEDKELPKFWYNIVADMKVKPAPYLNPVTEELLSPEDMLGIFPKEIVAQEMSGERYIPIPGKVQELYRTYRSTPLFRAYRLEEAIGTRAKIYYKYEGGNATGSHKLNTAIPQAYFNKLEGVKKIVTETGAGQWGSAISMASSMLDMECEVYMVKTSFQQKPYREKLMKVFGAKVFPSPSQNTEFGRSILEKTPDCTGSLGIAISEAVEKAVQDENTKYALGSVLNHVLLHQTVIGQEAKLQMEKMGDYPDVIFGCCGGGSNFAGIAFPFLADKLTGKRDIRAVAVEPKACPTLTEGEYKFDFGDTGKMTPISKMYSLGSDFIPSSIHAGGLRYHGASPLVSKLKFEGLIEAEAYDQKEIFEAARIFAGSEGIVPAPESSHAVKGALNEALKYRIDGQNKNEKAPVILFCLSGHGYFDLTSFDISEVDA